LDGPSLGTTGGNDTKGRVEYTIANGAATVYIYITHR